MIRRKALAELDPWIERAKTNRRGIRERRHQGKSRVERRDFLWWV
jgi:hypothetical protein